MITQHRAQHKTCYMLYVVYCGKKKHSKCSRESGFLAGVKGRIRHVYSYKGGYQAIFRKVNAVTIHICVYMCLPLVEMDRPI